MYLRILTLGMAVAMALGTSAQATPIVNYTFNSSTFDPSGVSGNLTAGTMSPNSLGTTPATGTSGYGFSTSIPSGGTANSFFVRKGSIPNSEALAVSGNDYLQFTLTPDSGYQTSFNTLTLFLGATGNSAGPVTMQSFAFLRSSLDSFATTIDGVRSSPTAAGATTNWNASASSFDISSLGTVTSATTFRLYLYGEVTGGSATNQDGAVHRLDTVVVDGTISPVPEPHSLALLGVAGLGGAYWIVRRRWIT